VSLIEDLGKIKIRAGKALDLLTEEAAKNALVMPFLRALGYDVFDPDVVIPEFTADVGTKKGEKVDYAIKIGNEISILVECKPANVDLDKAHFSQLYRYFTVTSARIGIATNGIDWHFYSDIDKPNIMDAKPFFKFNIMKHSDVDILEIEKFRAQMFDLSNILNAASDLKFTSLMMEELHKEFENPSEEMVRILTKRIYEGQITAVVRERFANILKACFREAIREQVNRRLLGAIQPPPVIDSPQDSNINGHNLLVIDEKIETTEEEKEGHRIIKAITRKLAVSDRVFIRDAASYCAILLDDNNRRPIARLYFGASKKRIGIFKDKIETKVDIRSLDDIYEHGDIILDNIKIYLDK
jgi:hypothetical protein